MKKIIKYSGIGAVVTVVVVLAVLRTLGVEPQDRRPGLWLTGEMPAMPVTDWSFSDEHAEIYLQTNTRWLIPHSVTVYCATLDGDLYLLSAYYTGGTFPEARTERTCLFSKNPIDPFSSLLLPGLVVCHSTHTQSSREG